MAVVICVRRVLGGQVGIANQTTMYKEETAAIAKLFERTMLRKHGPQEGPNRFMSLDTICDATQARRTSAHMRTHMRSGPDRFMPSTPPVTPPGRVEGMRARARAARAHRMHGTRARAQARLRQPGPASPARRVRASVRARADELCSGPAEGRSDGTGDGCRGTRRGDAGRKEVRQRPRAHDAAGPTSGRGLSGGSRRGRRR